MNDTTVTQSLPSFLRRRDGRVWCRFNLNDCIAFKPTTEYATVIAKKWFHELDSEWFYGTGFELIEHFGQYLQRGNPAPFNLNIELEVRHE